MGEHAILQNQAFLERFMQLMQAFRVKFSPSCQHLSSKIILLVRFVRKKYQNSHDLRVFLGVKFGLKILLRVKELIFRNSVALILLKMNENTQHDIN